MAKFTRIPSGRINQAMDFENNDKNWLFPFERMCKFYGKDFIEIIKVLWQVSKETMNEEQFCFINDLPMSFFQKHISN